MARSTRVTAGEILSGEIDGYMNRIYGNNAQGTGQETQPPSMRYPRVRHSPWNPHPSAILEDQEPDYQNYTSSPAPTAPSFGNRRFSVASSATTATTVFSRSDRGSTATSIVPSTQGSRNSIIALQLRARQQRGNGNALICDFADINSCGATFHLSEFDDWYHHIAVDHLENRLPPKCICWFCDEWSFDSRINNLHIADNFGSRMEHIREHLLDNTFSLDDVRRDFDFIDHLKRIQLIDRGTYERLCKTHEAPQVPNLYPYDWEPETPELQQQIYIDSRVLISQDREDRTRRRAEASYLHQDREDRRHNSGHGQRHRHRHHH